MRFSRFMDLALYDSESGFYSAGGQAGRRLGDFITSVEVGPLFGAVIAQVIDRHWRAAGQPARFYIAEAGAGVGTLYRTVHRAQPACLAALTWTLVEQSEQLRTHHASLPGAAWVSTGAMPTQRQHLVVANELLDNLSFDIAERVDHTWREKRVAAHAAVPGRFSFCLVDGQGALDHLDLVAPIAAVGAQIPVMHTAKHWVQAAREQADHVIAFDYGASTDELVGRGRDGWLRTYRDQQRGDDPLAEPGRWDITADVAWDQLGPDTQVSTQADWLRLAGIGELVDQARAVWAERVAIGDLQAMVARSAISEAEALTAADGLGGFLVLEWSGHDIDSSTDWTCERDVDRA